MSFAIWIHLTIWVHLYSMAFFQSTRLTLVTSAHVNHAVVRILAVVAEASSYASLEETATSIAGKNTVVLS
jgi:hypothetical protein